MTATGVLIVDDHDVLADTLALALRTAGCVVEVARDLSVDGVLAAVRQSDPDVVLLDIDLGEAGSGLDLLDPLRNRGVSVVLLTGTDDTGVLAAGLEAGASGFVGKGSGFDAVVDAIERAAAGEPVVPSSVREQLLSELQAFRANERERLRRFAQLTPRESEVLRALLGGKPAEAIASDQFVSIGTVRTQIRSILQKLGVHSQLAAVALAREAGWGAE